MGASVLQQDLVVNDVVLIGLCSVLALATSILWLIWRRSSSVDQHPPGPRGLPIVGHLHMLGTLPHHTLAHLSKRYGPLLSLRFGSLPAIVASSPAMAKLILHTHDKIFSGRPLNFIIPRIAFAGSPDIAFSLPSPYWKLLRQLCFTEFFSAKRLSYFKPMRVQEVTSLMLSIFAAQGAPLCIREMLIGTNMNLISRMALGKRLEEIAAEIPNSEKIVAALTELLGLVGMFNVGDYIPCLAWMDAQGYGRRSKKAARTTSFVLQEVIDRRRSGHSSDEAPRDFLDVLLLASLNSKNKELQIGDANIRAVLMDMFAAGTNSSAITTEWAIAELIINPEKMKTLQEELDQIVGCSQLVQETDLLNLPYLRAVVNETLRLHPAGPLLIPHMSMEPSQISGYQIPKNTLVYVNVWAIHRDPNIWDNPLEFSPERFLDNNNIDVLTWECKFLPFGAGRRSCPGAALALMSVQHVLANLIHAFDWRTLAKPNLREKFGLAVALEEPLVVVPVPKLPKALLHTLT